MTLRIGALPRRHGGLILGVVYKSGPLAAWLCRGKGRKRVERTEKGKKDDKKATTPTMTTSLVVASSFQSSRSYFDSLCACIPN